MGKMTLMRCPYLRKNTHLVVASAAPFFLYNVLTCDVRDLPEPPSFQKKPKQRTKLQQSSGGGVNSTWSTLSKMERQLLHQVGHPPQNASDIAKQIVGLAGHSASPHPTALVLNVSLSTAWFQTYVDLNATLRASCSEQENQCFELAHFTMAQTCKTQVDITTHVLPNMGANCWSQFFCIVDKLTIRM